MLNNYETLRFKIAIPDAGDPRKNLDAFLKACQGLALSEFANAPHAKILPTLASTYDIISREEAYDVFEKQNRYLQGEILTIIDAAFNDKEQRKAVKDLVRSKFNDRFKWVFEALTGNRMTLATDEVMPPL